MVHLFSQTLVTPILLHRGHLSYLRHNLGYFLSPRAALGHTSLLSLSPPSTCPGILAASPSISIFKTYLQGAHESSGTLLGAGQTEVLSRARYALPALGLSILLGEGKYMNEEVDRL